MIKKETILSIGVFATLSLMFALSITYSFSLYRYIQSKNATFYDSKLEKTTSWLGPKIGEKLDLSNLKDNNGKFLIENRKENLLMLLVIDPKCIICQKSTNQMRELESQAKQISIDFAIVSFNPSIPMSDLQNFNETANLSSTFYSFGGKDPNLKLQFPTYILVNTDNKILRIFAGSNTDEQIQREMSKEIIKDTLKEKEL